MLCEDKLPEFTGDKLTAGEMIPTFLGELDWTLLGEDLNCIGEVTPLNV